jgi:hypothetical protein
LSEIIIDGVDWVRVPMYIKFMRKVRIPALLMLLVLPVSSAYAADKVNTYGDFDLYSDQDPFDDSDTSYVQTKSLEDEDITLSWLCKGTDTTVKLIPRYTTLKDKEGNTVSYRVDKNKPVTSDKWLTINRETALYIPKSLVKPITLEATTGQKAVFRVFDYNENYKDYSFKLKGLNEALAKLKCRY